MLVSGYSGIGKSAVVNELHKALVPPRGLFASGKFDQYKRDIPYSTLAQAFQSLVRPLLGKSDAELAAWRDAFQEALGPTARLMVDLIPELKLIIGEQPPVPELRAAAGAKPVPAGVPALPRRLRAAGASAGAVPRRSAVAGRGDARPARGSADPAGSAAPPVIGAYRDNEVDAAHPLMRKLDAIRTAEAKVRRSRWRRSARDDLGQLIADALRCEPEHAAPLAELVHEKTAGNPFFAIQFLHALAEEGLARASIMTRRAGPGISSAFAPRVTPTTSWTSWSAS